MIHFCNFHGGRSPSIIISSRPIFRILRFVGLIFNGRCLHREDLNLTTINYVYGKRYTVINTGNQCNCHNYVCGQRVYGNTEKLRRKIAYTLLKDIFQYYSSRRDINLGRKCRLTTNCILPCCFLLKTFLLEVLYANVKRKSEGNFLTYV